MTAGGDGPPGTPEDGPGAGRFDGQIALVTGGASGIGRALGAALAARDTTVVLADLDGPGARRVAGELGGSAEGAVLDVTDAEAVEALVRSVADRHGRIDLLFNNAGIGAGGPAETLSLADWRRVIDVDLYGVVHGVAAAYPLMVRQGSGHIVNTASLAGLVP
ncbi:MAG TPA: SDR family NAD(P)-dependent oxidoreductase, partial [Acidimicrobiales bacterium]|nr:SDR family NAD(P)-dependent oxidoreductase [Acidimicrobiales bacterium]